MLLGIRPSMTPALVDHSSGDYIAWQFSAAIHGMLSSVIFYRTDMGIILDSTISFLTAIALCSHPLPSTPPSSTLGPPCLPAPCGPLSPASPSDRPSFPFPIAWYSRLLQLDRQPLELLPGDVQGG